MTPALRLSGVTAGYGSTQILHGVDLTVGRGKVVALLGRNGVGKTTLVKAAVGLLKLRGGRIFIGEREVTGQPAHRIARNGVAYVPQEAGVFDELTVRENFEMVLGRGDVLERAAERAFAAFPVLEQRMEQKAGTLSGGERKMLMTARLLIQRADLLVLDEVSEGVQPSNVAMIAGALREERERGASVLLVEQKLDFALGLADRFVVLKHGEVVQAGVVGPETAAAVTEHLVL